MMSVVGKSTCSGFKTGLYISYHGENVVRYIKQRGYFMKRCSNFWLFWYQMYGCTSNRTHFTQFWIFFTSNRSIFTWHSSSVFPYMSCFSLSGLHEELTISYYKTPPLRNLCLKLCHVYVPEWRPQQRLFFSLVTLSLNNIWGKRLYQCRRFMNKVFKYTTENALAYGVLEPLHFSCKIDTKTAKAL